MQIRGVAFDLDGTLCSYRSISLHSVSLFIRHPRFLYHYGRVRTRIRTMRPVDDLERLQAELLSERMGVSLTEAGSLIKRIVYAEWIERFRRVRPYPGLKTLLSQLKAQGLRIAVLSDYPVERKLKYLGLLQEGWDALLSSEVTQYLKPNPEPFGELLSRWGLPAEAVLYVGDDYEYDVLGARAAGMRTAHLTSRPVRKSLATFTFRDYYDFARQLAQLGKVI